MSGVRGRAFSSAEPNVGDTWVWDGDEWVPQAPAAGGDDTGPLVRVVEPSGLDPAVDIGVEDETRYLRLWVNDGGDTSLWLQHDSPGNDTRGIIKMQTDAGFISWQAVVSAFDDGGNVGVSLGSTSAQAGTGFVDIFTGASQTQPALLVQDSDGNYIFKVLAANEVDMAGVATLQPAPDGTNATFTLRGEPGAFGSPRLVLSSGNNGDGTYSAQVNFAGLSGGEAQLRARDDAVFLRLTGVPSQSDSDPILRIHDENDSALLEVFNSGTVRLSNPGGATVEVSAEGVKMPGLPTSDPAIADALWNNAGILSVSAG